MNFQFQSLVMFLLAEKQNNKNGRKVIITNYVNMVCPKYSLVIYRNLITYELEVLTKNIVFNLYIQDRC